MYVQHAGDQWWMVKGLKLMAVPAKHWVTACYSHPTVPKKWDYSVCDIKLEVVDCWSCPDKWFTSASLTSWVHHWYIMGTSYIPVWSSIITVVIDPSSCRRQLCGATRFSTEWRPWGPCNAMGRGGSQSGRVGDANGICVAHSSRFGGFTCRFFRVFIHARVGIFVFIQIQDFWICFNSCGITRCDL